ncbi:MAG: hypothetical protein HAW67_06565, partial [Endozoicomonadaceae bacterium]|nr:hypothetical protein [Endozoicomonadaceae bacterium]
MPKVTSQGGNSPNIKNRTIFCRDNIDVLKRINSSSIDLIYLDPPFNKKKNFTAPIGSSAEGASFNDIFRLEDIKDEWVLTIKEDNISLYELLDFAKKIEGRQSYNYCYLAYMSIRLLEMHRILKDTGSIYFHCDATMSHYLKLAMDCIFGDNNYRNEIIWERHTSTGKGSQFKKKKFGNVSDTLFFYTKSNDYFFNGTRPLSKEEETTKFPFTDSKGQSYNKATPIFRAKSMGARPNLCYEWKGHKNPHPSGWRLSKETLEREYKKGNIVIRSDGKIERRSYLKDYKGVPIGNIWSDIKPVLSSKESTGYPTQKPLALLERIIEAGSKTGDLVLDPFCGCATTCVAAEKLKRNWVGIDISHKAYELVKTRLLHEVEDMYMIENIDKDVHFSTDPPNRTDLGVDYSDEKYVYIISNAKAFPGLFKIGIAKDPKKRLNAYQTSSPDRNYKLEYFIKTPVYRELEKSMHVHEDFL